MRASWLEWGLFISTAPHSQWTLQDQEGWLGGSILALVLKRVQSSSAGPDSHILIVRLTVRRIHRRNLLASTATVHRSMDHDVWLSRCRIPPLLIALFLVGLAPHQAIISHQPEEEFRTVIFEMRLLGQVVLTFEAVKHIF